MEVLEKCRKLQLCPCFKKCQEFQKLVELKDYGLVIYCHRRSTQNIRQNEAVDSAENISGDVFILHNKRDVKLTISQLTSKLEKENISCPRCIKKIKHAQELMKEVKSLDRRNVMGVCDHCRKISLRSKNPFCVCEKIVKLFKTVKGEQTEGSKTYLYCNLQINQDIKPPAAEDKPDVQQMFYPDTHFQSDDTEMSETDSKKTVDVYETPKNAPREQTQPIPKYHGSEMEIKKIQTKPRLGSSSLVGKVKKPGQSVKKSKSEPVALPKVKEKQVKQINVKSSELNKDFYDNNTKSKEQKQQGQKKQRGKSKESLLGKEVAKIEESKPAQKVKDGAEEKSYLEGKDKELLDQAEKLRDIKLLTEKDKLKEKKQMKESNKVASANIEKFNKKKLESSVDIKRSTSNKDELSEEDKVKEVSIKMKKGGEIKESLKDQKETEEFLRLRAEYLKSKSMVKKQLDKQRVEKKQKQEAESEKNIIMQSHRSDEFLKLVKIKQTAKISPFDITNEMLKAHTGHRKWGHKSATCPVCLDSELELDVLSINYERNLKKDKLKSIIVGEKIYRCKPGFEKNKKPEGVIPIIFQKDVFLKSQEEVQIIPQKAEDVLKMKEVDTEANAGIIRYALSDRTFIDKGWTVLPTEKVLRMMNVYRMRPARPEFDWFKHNKNKELMTYDTGERLAEFDDNGRGRWYYRNGRLALDYYDAEETNAQQRFVIYSSGERDERGRTHPITILATFDYLGNGIVFDHAGKIRLKYNQTEGVVLDRSIGPVSHWKWHTLNDPPVLQQVMIDTQLAHKDPDILKLGPPADDKTRSDNEEMLAIEFDNFIKEKSKKLSQNFKPFQIKMKALKINEHFSLRVLDQATVYLIFRDGLTNLKINMGMILDEKEIVDTNAAEMGNVSNSLEQFPARTDSLAGLQRSVAHARRYERQHAERKRRLQPQEPCASTDLMFAAASKPMRLPFRTVPTGSASTTRYCSRKSSNNLYYDTRLLC